MTCVGPFSAVRRFAALATMLVMGCDHRSREAEIASTRAMSLSGTYAVTLCHEPCVTDDTTGSVLTGHVVLLDASLFMDHLPASRREYFHSSGTFMDDDGPLNACFVFKAVVPENDPLSKFGYFHGVRLLSLSSWKRTHDGIEFTLFRATDSRVGVRLVSEGDRIEGRIDYYRPTAMLELAEAFPPHVTGRRLGNADLGVCMTAPLPRPFTASDIHFVRASNR